MNTPELNAAMARKGLNAKDLSNAIKKSHVSFNKKRYGEVPFDVNEVREIASALALTIEQVDVIFFDGSLRGSNSYTVNAP